MATSVVVLGSGATLGGRHTDLGPVRAERAVLERQVEGLEHQIAQGRSGRVVTFDQCLITIDAALLHDLLAASLPYETSSGPFHVRITNASVECEDGFALVQMRARASLSGLSDSTAFADADVYGTLRRFDVDQDEGLLRGHVDVIAVDVRRVELGGLRDESMRGLLADLARLETEAFQGLDFSFGIPVRLGRGVVLPAIRTRRVRIHTATLPLDVAVTGVSATNGRLWIAFRLDGERLPPHHRADSLTASSAP